MLLEQAQDQGPGEGWCLRRPAPFSLPNSRLFFLWPAPSQVIWRREAGCSLLALAREQRNWWQNWEPCGVGISWRRFRWVFIKGWVIATRAKGHFKGLRLWDLVFIMARMLCVSFLSLAWLMFSKYWVNKLQKRELEEGFFNPPFTLYYQIPFTPSSSRFQWAVVSGWSACTVHVFVSDSHFLGYFPPN